MPDERQDLLLEIQANAANAVSDLQRLTDSLAKLSGETEKGKQKVKGFSDGFTALQAKIVATNAAIGILKDSYNAITGVLSNVTNATLGQARALAEYNQQLKNVTTQLGVSTQFYQTLEVRLQRLGLGTEAARQSLFTFNRTLEAARQGAGQAAEVIQKLNVNVDRSRSIENIYLDVAKAITSLSGSTERALAAQTLFGRAGAQQLVVLKELASGTGEFGARLEKLGIILDQDVVASADRVDEALNRINESTRGLSTQWQKTMANVVAPGAEVAADALETMAVSVKANQEQLEELIRLIGVLATTILAPAGTVAAIAATTKAVAALRIAIAGMGTSLTFATGGLSILTGLLAAGASAWLMYGNEAERAGEKARAASRGSATPGPFGEEPTYEPRSGDLDPNAMDIGLPTPGAPALGPTRGQVQRNRQAQAQLDQARAAAAISSVERSRGRIAAIQEELKWEQHRIEQERKFALEEAELIGDTAARKQEIANIDEASRQEQLAAEIRFGALITDARRTQGEDRRKIAEQEVKDTIEHAASIHRIAEEVLAEQRQLFDQLTLLEAEAFGSPQEQRIAQLMVAQDDLIRQLGDAGMVGEIERVREAYAQMFEEAQAGFLDLGDVIENAVGDAFEGIIAGTRDAEDILDGFRASVQQAFARAFAEALREKLKFDVKFNVNFLGDLVGTVRKAATIIAKIFSNLFQFMSSGQSGSGPSPSVTEGGTSVAGSFSGLLGSFGFGGGGSAAAGAGAAEAGGFTAGFGGQSTIGGTSAFGGGGIEAGAGGGTSGAGGSGVGGGFALAGIMANIAAFQAAGDYFKRNKLRLDLSASEYIQGIQGAAYGASLEGFGVPKFIAEPIGKAYGRLPVLAQDIINPLNPMFRAMGLFQQKTEGTRIGASLQDIANAGRVFQTPQGFRHFRFDEAALFGSEVSRFGGLGYPSGLMGEGESASVRAGLLGAYAPGTDVGAISGLRTGPALALAQILYSEGGAGAVVSAANQLTNQILAVGLGADEAKEQLKAFAEAAGIDVAGGLFELNAQGLNAVISTDQLTATAADLLDLLGDLPTAIDETAIVMEALRKTQNGAYIDTKAFNEEIEKQLRLHEGFEEVLGTVGQQMVEWARTYEAALKAFVERTINSADLARIINTNSRSIRQAIAGGFRDVLQAELTGGIVKDFLESSEWKGIFSLLVSGDPNLDVGKMVEDVIKNLEPQFQGVARFLLGFDEYIESMADGTGEIVVNAEKLKQTLDDIARSALSEALSIDPREVEALQHQYALDAEERTAEIRRLEVGIQQARLLGDSIQAAELEMQKRTLMLAVSPEVKDAQQVFADALKDRIRESVTEGLVEGFLAKEVIQNAVKPLLTQLEVVNTAFAKGEISLEQAKDLSRIFINAANVPNIGNIADLVGFQGTELLRGLDGGGAGAGAGSTIVVNNYVTGNTIADQATADYLVRQMNEQTLRQVKLNGFTGH